MKVLFEIEQSEGSHSGASKCHTSIVALDIDPATISQKDRDLLADRLIGINVCQLWNDDMGTTKSINRDGSPIRVVSKAPSYEALMEAVREDQEMAEERQARHREFAMAMAMAMGGSQN